MYWTLLFTLEQLGARRVSILNNTNVIVFFCCEHIYYEFSFFFHFRLLKQQTLSVIMSQVQVQAPICMNVPVVFSQKYSQYPFM